MKLRARDLFCGAGGATRGQTDFTLAEGRTALGIDWMSGAELSQAIPPAYAEFIARAWLAWRELL